MEAKTEPKAVERTFEDIPDDRPLDINLAFETSGWPGSKSTTWTDLLMSPRVLLYSEAGAGKTYECRQHQQLLWHAGEPAFFVELAQLATSQLREMLDPDEERRLDLWIAGGAETATFFLDSVDELQLTLGSFEQALKRLARALGGNLGRARIVITSRPVPVDEELAKRILPVPAQQQSVASGTDFASAAMREVPVKTADPLPTWRRVVLSPLSRDQIRLLASTRGVQDVDAFMQELARRNAEDFTRRPQDLIELCSEWREGAGLRRHSDQVASDIRIKLSPSDSRREPASLSGDMAFEGCSRLALAALLTRRLTFRHGADKHPGVGDGKVVEPRDVLSDWDAKSVDALMQRPIFEFASYGRVRLHHRSVVEYLAAQRLGTLLQQGTPLRAIRRVLFADTIESSSVIRPSMRPTSAWLALFDYRVFEEVLLRDPGVLVECGDPQTLTPDQQTRVLTAYIEQHGKGGWRGLHSPLVQVHRLASAHLGATINALWSGVENPEVRTLLLDLIAAGQIKDCADLAYAAALDEKNDTQNRLNGLQTLMQLNDVRIADIRSELLAGSESWPEDLGKSAAITLFPTHVPVGEMLTFMRRFSDEPDDFGGISWHLPRAIDQRLLSAVQLQEMGDGLSAIILEKATYVETWPHFRTDAPYLIDGLAAICLQLLDASITPRAETLAAALAFSDPDRDRDEPKGVLRKRMEHLPPQLRRGVFWAHDSIRQTLRSARGFGRYFSSAVRGPIVFGLEDMVWLREDLRNEQLDDDQRELLLHTVLRIRGMAPTRDMLEGWIGDSLHLRAVLDEALRERPIDQEMQKIEVENRRSADRANRKTAKDKESWAAFWREVSSDPERAFSQSQVENTTWNIWRVMQHESRGQSFGGWNRSFLESHFGSAITERTRTAIKELWRAQRPTLRSERAPKERDTYFLIWQLGLAGISAEAEETGWAMQLTEGDASLAARYAPLELNRFPDWFDDLVVSQMNPTRAVLGTELSRQLGLDREAADSMLLQKIEYGSSRAASIFLPAIRSWLFDHPLEDRNPHQTQQAITILLKHGDDGDRDRLLGAVTGRPLNPTHPLALVWLSTGLKLDFEKASVGLERMVEEFPDQAASVLGGLFGEGRSVGVSLEDAPPARLLRLLLLAHKHINPADDVVHRGSYTPDERDFAERARSALFSALIRAKGTDAWSLKLSLASHTEFADLKDRILALAREQAAKDADIAEFTVEQFGQLDRYNELPPITRDDIFSLMLDRLGDFRDAMSLDTSPREVLALIKEERIMRREFARYFNERRGGAYTVDQEGVTAHEKETDIRLRATASDQQAAIELKIGDKDRSAADLEQAIDQQLLTKYLSADNCRAGCLLVTVADPSRRWKHPRTGRMLDAEGLEALLRERSRSLAASLFGQVRLEAIVLPLY